jgi:Ca-activated chloride channel family protein
MKGSYLLKTIGWLALFAITVCAQSLKTNAEDEQILLNVTVMTKNGDLITGLKAENFKVYDEKTLQPLTFFSAEDVPMSVGILVDKSESVRDVSMPSIQQALMSFVNRSNPENEYFLMSFNTIQDLLLDNTQNGKILLQAIEKLTTIKSTGNTKFYDAVQVGLEKVIKGKYQKKVLIILSDGVDNQSKNDLGDIEKLIKQKDVLLYNLNINYVYFDRLLETQFQVFSLLTKLSGGKSYILQKTSNYNEILYRTAEELRSQYTIGYKINKIKHKDNKEKWNKVEVKVEIPSSITNIGKPYISSREGYYSNAKSN